ncbi:MAG: radical SAM protein [Anaerolineales bacterium]|nr:radical SAM protein [Anaerolineales bacterium]
MSLLALGAILEGRHDYRIIDGNLVSDPLRSLDDAIASSGACTLGITVMPGPQLQNAVPISRAIKQKHPHVRIVWGGYFPTQHYEACVTDEAVNFVVRGHGEYAFASLVDLLESGGENFRMPGISFFDEDLAKIIDGGLAPLPHPRELPDLFPYHRVEVERYVRPTFLGSRTLPHHSSYGCPFFCNFCAVVNMVDGRWKAQSAEQTARVAEYLVKTYGVNAMEFDDNNFFTHEDRIAEFCERIGRLNIRWWGEARIDTMLKFSERTWSLMRAAGLKMVFLGAESGSDETLARMNKGGKASIEKTLAIAERMKAYNIIPEMSFVLGNPPDPEKDARQTIGFIRKVKQINPATEIIMYMYTPVPLAGELYERARAAGFNFPETLDGWISPEWLEFSQRRSVHVPWMKDPIRRQIQDFQWVLNAFFPTTTDIHMRKWKRLLLRGAAAWRYHTGLYRNPLELKALHRIASYQRPETSGF